MGLLLPRDFCYMVSSTCSRQHICCIHIVHEWGNNIHNVRGQIKRGRRMFKAKHINPSFSNLCTLKLCVILHTLSLTIENGKKKGKGIRPLAELNQWLGPNENQSYNIKIGPPLTFLNMKRCVVLRCISFKSIKVSAVIIKQVYVKIIYFVSVNYLLQYLIC